MPRPTDKVLLENASRAASRPCIGDFGCRTEPDRTGSLYSSRFFRGRLDSKAGRSHIVQTNPSIGTLNTRKRIIY